MDLNNPEKIKEENKMKSIIKAVLIYFSISTALAVDHTFSYQGELLDGGTPANGTYTIAIQAYDAVSLGITVGSASSHTGVQVSNGLFTITDVNLGASTFDGLDIWLEVKVKGPSDASFITLSPRHKMKSVPYANTLIDKGATNGQVLTFDNTNGWQPSTIPSGSDNQNLSLSGTTLSITNGTSASFTGWDNNAADDFSGNYNDLSNKPTIPAASPWLANGAGIDYLGDVSIGTTDATHSLTVLAEDDNALRLMGSQGVVNFGAKLNFGDGDYAYIQEDDDDALTILAERTAIISDNVGIGTTNPTEQLTVTGNGRAFFGSQTPGDAATVGLLIDGINSGGASRLESYDYTAAEGRTLVINSVGQGAVSIGTGSPATSAKLQVESTTQGFLPPRMTTAQRDAIASPVNGLTIYNTDNNCNEIYILNAYWDNLCDNMSAVVSGGGRIWLDRNLGAANIGDKGDLFQWGRAADGHEKRDSYTTTTLATSATPFIGSSTVWDGLLITNNIYPHDWLQTHNDNLWQGVNGVNNPCPSGFRVPTLAEWTIEKDSWTTQNYAGSYLSPLKLPKTSIRLSTNGNIILQDEGEYWSSTIDASFPTYSSIIVSQNSGIDTASNSPRGQGLAVRCIMD